MNNSSQLEKVFYRDHVIVNTAEGEWSVFEADEAEFNTDLSFYQGACVQDCIDVIKEVVADLEVCQ